MGRVDCKNQRGLNRQDAKKFRSIFLGDFGVLAVQLAFVFVLVFADR
jgi:hypothetical protein